jgi:four helix bundle protein
VCGGVGGERERERVCVWGCGCVGVWVEREIECVGVWGCGCVGGERERVCVGAWVRGGVGGERDRVCGGVGVWVCGWRERESGCVGVWGCGWRESVRVGVGVVKHFRELRVYREAFDAAMRIFECSKTWPKEERYSLTDQIRRSSRSVCEQVAEAWRKRRYIAHFTSKLTDADSETAETQSWLEFALRCGYIGQEAFDELDRVYERISGGLVNMMAHADQWCISCDHVKEEGFEYGGVEELPPHTHTYPHTHIPTHKPLPQTTLARTEDRSRRSHHEKPTRC